MRGLVYLHDPDNSAPCKAAFPVLHTLTAEQGQETEQTQRTMLTLIAGSATLAQSTFVLLHL